MADQVSIWNLIERLGDERDEVRLMAREEILQLGQTAAPALVEAIDSGSIPEKAMTLARDTLAAIQPRFAGDSGGIDRGGSRLPEFGRIRSGFPGVGELRIGGNRTSVCSSHQRRQSNLS